MGNSIPFWTNFALIRTISEVKEPKDLMKGNSERAENCNDLFG
jgi:hypothetical protein